MSTLFCMVSSKVSESYTAIALETFFLNTVINKEDIFLFIDNDATNNFRNIKYPINIYENNNTPKSWASNFNKGIKIALGKKMDMVLITNDIAFAKGWYDPLKILDNAITIPCCNIYVNYRTPNFRTNVLMNLSDYSGKEQDLDQCVHHHKLRFKLNEFCEKKFTQMYLARIPHIILNKVGYFDETISNCGGEDIDFIIRAALNGYKTLVAYNSYVIHFHGKSSWDGSETHEQANKRRDTYLKRCKEKWGNNLIDVFLSNKGKEKAYELGLKNLYDENKFYEIIRILLKKK